MAYTTLKDDLLAEFREERTMITDQIDILDPLAISFRRPAASRMLSSSTLLLTEYICYFISVSGVAFMAFMHMIYPFSLLSDVFYTSRFRNGIGWPNLVCLTIAVYGLFAICIFFVFCMGRMIREVKLKNEILDMAGKDIKTLMGQHLERKAAIDTIEQRHMLGAPAIAPDNAGNNDSVQHLR